ncbi:anthranilate synthase component I family protein [Paenisporosarcina quisquiliarum]|uniref:Anthranilate synthase component I family protein n=1 Tax=Paenisporosarcina quisquiliarum TaxID=365346 RepID=A0A9X3LI99_9BACL|nr:anthranilate synthase component I family protein [Paenisporosarcina quisquiliarum]MCZ8538522.1 anthranilate synthase component I family protein [Paenisporosarcina quisquiliarum]
MRDVQLHTTTISLNKDEFYYAYKYLTQHESHHILMESGRGGNYSVASWNPLAVVESTEDGLRIEWRDGEVEERQGEALQLVEELVAEYRFQHISELPDFQGGAAGFITYDYARQIEALPNEAEDDLHIPDLYFYLLDQWTVLDIEKELLHIMHISTASVDLQAESDKWMEAAKRGVASRVFSPGVATEVREDHTELHVSMTGPAFEEAVRRIQTYIGQGDVFQVNLSVRQSKALSVSPVTYYEALRSFNPSPYMAFIQSPEFAVVSGSPELLVKKKGDELSTRPIAGTRPRGKSEEEDELLAKELIDNEKERAEHVMLVDLERNDLGRVSSYGSVEVNEFMVIEKYSHVMHIVSNVRGTLAANTSNAEVIRAVFPGGTITGAPKIRTMEIIEELEPVRRGLYTGSIGWLGYTGDLEFNIVIRTAFVRNGIAHIQAGAGIVIDSSPENEYIESLNKAKALWQAKAMAEGVGNK